MLSLFRSKADGSMQVLLDCTEQPSIVIGREAACDVVLVARGVSRTHCKLTIIKDRWYIHDLQSTNGTIIQRQSQLPLKLKGEQTSIESEDRLHIGDAVLTLKIGRNDPAATECFQLNFSDCATEALGTPGPLPAYPMAPSQSNRSLRPLGNSEGPPHPLLPPATYVSSNRKDVGAVSKSSYSPVAGEANHKTVTSGKNVARRLPFNFRSYNVIKKIGQGGMGEVFLAQPVALGQHVPFVAVKFLRDHDASSQDKARFMREMEIAVKLKHPAIIDCYDCGQEKGELFIVMPYCSGGNLTELLERSGALTIRRALRLMDRILAGMDMAHQQGIVHRDLKPQNILLARDSKGKFLPLVSDFGLAKSYLLAGNSGMTVNGTVGGSWAYMPKEQLTNFRFVTPQSDVWSLGAILYACLTLRPPRLFVPGGDPIKELLTGKVDPIESVLPELPKSLAKFVMNSVAVDTGDRYGDAGEMRRALRAVAASEGVEL